MRPLTEHQRELVEHRIALAIGFGFLFQDQKDKALRTAKRVVDEMERGAVSGASEKRALEILLGETA